MVTGNNVPQCFSHGQFWQKRVDMTHKAGEPALQCLYRLRIERDDARLPQINTGDRSEQKRPTTSFGQSSLVLH